MVPWWNRAPPLPLPADPLLDRLWARFVADVPAAATFARVAGRFGNDHLALQTLARPGSGLALFARVFERRGWRAASETTFPDRHLRALQLSRAGFPRISIAELDSSALPSQARAALSRLPADAPPPDDDDALAAWFKAPLPPSGADLDLLERASPVGAWLLAFGRRVERFAASIADIEEWQRRLSSLGVAMEADIEGDPDAPLRRVATKRAALDVRIRDGSTRRLPFACLELIERQQGFDGLFVPEAPGAAKGHKPRRYPRVATVLNVELSYGSLRVPVVSENLSLGGMFLQLADEDAPGANAVLQLKIELPAGAIDALATVIFRVPGRGVGVEFQWWDDEQNPDRRALESWLGSLS